jgi:hypothetical protein
MVIVPCRFLLLMSDQVVVIEKKNELIRRGRLQIASLIDKLPASKHDLRTFTIDITLATVR